ncbi:homoserine O-acetyltransferase, partial [Mycena pura]
MALVPKNTSTLTLPEFNLECGVSLRQVDVVYKTWGTFNRARNNVMVICHPFTGSVDVDDWWNPLFGCGKALDPTRFLIFCANVLGSPFGTASPMSTDPVTGRPYGPEFPPTTLRDDVRLHKLILDHLGATSVAAVIGGSMGGMTALEWPLCFPEYVRRVVPMATCAKQSAWCIAWGEAQRQTIASDAAFDGGYYAPQYPPMNGLAAARMAGLLTYRSRDSYEARFGRNVMAQALPLCNAQKGSENGCASTGIASAHGHPGDEWHPTYSAQSYLRYKGRAFADKFDANCYVHITHKMDTHDLARGRVSEAVDDAAALEHVLGTLPPRALVISIDSDGLCPPHEQKTLADGMPDAQLVVIDSLAGHDGFLVEGERINAIVLEYLRHELEELYVDVRDA